MGNRQTTGYASRRGMGLQPGHPDGPTSACTWGAGFVRPLLTAVVGLSLAVACGVGQAQTQIACNITEVKVKQLSNAVQITLKADGLLTTRARESDFYTVAEDGSWNKVWRKDVPLRITNARSEVGSFVDIGLYPVNYLELSTPAESREGVGLNVRLVLYRAAWFRRIKVDNMQVEWAKGWRRHVMFDVIQSQNRRKLIVTVWSDRREETAEPKKPRRELDLPSELEVDFSEGRLSVSAVNAPLEAVMERVSEATGVPILVDDLVKRLATVRLTGVDLDGFVNGVVTGYGLTAVKQDGAYFISDGLPTSLAPYTAAETRIFPVKYLGAETAINLLPNFLLRYLRPSASGDAVIAQGPAQLLDRIGEDLAVLDKPVQAVRVRAVMVQAHGMRASQRLWHLLRGGDHTTVGVDVGEGSLSFRRGEQPLDHYVAAIRALREREQVDVKVQPALVVRPGASAEIFVGEREYYQQQARYWWQQRMQLRHAEAGVRLWCWPRATGSGLIETHVRLEVSTLRRGLAGGPIVDRRNLRGTLLLSSGDTLIVGGGLYPGQSKREQRRARTAHGLPLLAHTLEGPSDVEELHEVLFLLRAEQMSVAESASDMPVPEEMLEG